MGLFSKIGGLLKKALPIVASIVPGGSTAMRALSAAKALGVKPTPIPKIQPVSVRSNISKFVPSIPTSTALRVQAKRQPSKATKAKKAGEAAVRAAGRAVKANGFSPGAMKEIEKMAKRDREEEANLRRILGDKRYEEEYGQYLTAPGTPKAKAAGKKGGKRSAPSGGLDLAKIGSMWRAQGKPGTWQGFVKANAHIRK